MKAFAAVIAIVLAVVAVQADWSSKTYTSTDCSGSPAMSMGGAIGACVKIADTASIKVNGCTSGSTSDSYTTSDCSGSATESKFDSSDADNLGKCIKGANGGSAMTTCSGAGALSMAAVAVIATLAMML